MSKEGSKRRKSTIINKKQLWSVFDSEIKNNNPNTLECIYRVSGNRDFCDCCESILAF